MAVWRRFIRGRVTMAGGTVVHVHRLAIAGLFSNGHRMACRVALRGIVTHREFHAETARGVELPGQGHVAARGGALDRPVVGDERAVIRGTGAVKGQGVAYGAAGWTGNNGGRRVIDCGVCDGHGMCRRAALGCGGVVADLQADRITAGGAIGMGGRHAVAARPVAEGPGIGNDCPIIAGTGAVEAQGLAHQATGRGADHRRGWIVYRDVVNGHHMCCCIALGSGGVVTHREGHAETAGGAEQV